MFYHRQDAVDLAQGHGVWLRYGPIDGRGLPAAKIAAIVCKVLNDVGLRYAWEGDTSKAIDVLSDAEQQKGNIS